VRTQIVLHFFQKSVEHFGSPTLLKNIGLQIAKELYSANPKLTEAHGDSPW
jgi:hypothetical protein